MTPEILKSRLRLPLIGAPMFIISGPELVIAQCKAGIVGSFPALNAREEGDLEAWIQQIQAELAKWDHDNPDHKSAPFAVNQIVHRTNARLDRDLGICCDLKVPLIISSLGAQPAVNTAVHDYGGMVLHDVINADYARKAIDKGADGLIAVAAGAGGHAGNQSPFALVQEIRSWFTGPLALSGAIANGRSLLAARAMGADFGYAGSVFIATHEANAVPDYKDMIVACSAKDIVYTDFFSGIHANYLRPTVIKSGFDPEELARAPRSQMNIEERRKKGKVWKDVWGSGHGIGAVDAITDAASVIDRLSREYQQARAELLA